MADNTLNPRQNDGLGPERMQRRPTVPPPVEIYENTEEILVVADVPGARPDGITVKVDKGEMTLLARREDEVPQGKLLYGLPRRGDYARTFLVPRGIEADKIVAEMNAGVLSIHLPKSEEVKPRRIQVKAA